MRVVERQNGVTVVGLQAVEHVGDSDRDTTCAKRGEDVHEMSARLRWSAHRSCRGRPNVAARADVSIDGFTR